MNRHLSIRPWMLLATWCLTLTLQAQELARRLTRMPDISRIEAMESADEQEKVMCYISQQTDWQQKEAGTFSQRLIIRHRGFDRPTVLVTEGYAGDYGLSQHYQEELARLLDANTILVQHRYFKESTPQPCNWDYLTVANSADDYHHIRQLLGKLYKGKWFTTGISKGGQTTLFYRTFYPEDVDGSVCYVAPLNKSLEDGRHEPFLQQAGTRKERKAIEAFQKEVLRRRATLQPLFEDYCQQKGYTFRTSMSEVYDLTVLEYAFSYFQWGSDISQIPSLDVSDDELLRYFVTACDPGYFAEDSPNIPFFVQAMREIGYYGYDIKPFEGLLSIDHAEGYVRRVMIPEELDYIEFDTSLYERVMAFLRNEDCPMMFIYGGDDPWTATGMTWLKDKEQMHVFVEKGGSHLARVGTMPAKVQKQIKDIFNQWLDED